MAKPQFSLVIREQVMSRANHCCEYCKSQDKFAPHFFTIDHIVALSVGGSDELDNLAYACFLCNRLKSNKTALLDELTQVWGPIFNPRIDTWATHFAWNEDATHVIGLTTTGRSTVTQLQLNRAKLIEYRRALVSFGEHPPI